MNRPFERDWKHPYIVRLADDSMDGQPQFQCEICNTKSVFEASLLEEHCSSEIHGWNLEVMKRTQENPLAHECALLYPRMATLGLREWGWQVESSLLNAFITKTIYHEGSRDLKKAKKLLLSFEKLERLSLLELAVWKAMCQLKFDDDSFVTVVAVDDATDAGGSNKTKQHKGTFHDWLELSRRGWKGAKRETRRCNEIAIIVTAVMLFLDTRSSHSSLN